MKATITTTTATDDEYVNDSDFELYGTWDGASIDLQMLTLNGDWDTLATYTEDTFDARFEPARDRLVRFKASSVGGSTSVKVAIGK